MDFTSEIEKILLSKESFDKAVYTPLDEAVIELERRQKDKELKVKIESALSAGVPEIFKSGKKAAIFRHVITPNYETRRFLSLIDAFGTLTPAFCEYTKDKFTPNNRLKLALGKLVFHKGKGKKGGDKTMSVNVIDFISVNGKRISDIKTIWGQNLHDFHRDFFLEAFPQIKKDSFFDASEWFARSGLSAKNYYESLLKLFVCHAILFENFLIDKNEYEFTRDIFLPAFLKVLKETGKKPLIVALEPTEIEGDEFWSRHPHESFSFLEKKINKTIGV